MLDPQSDRPMKASDIAALLTYVRESKGRSIADVSKLIKVPPRVLEEIEAGHIDRNMDRVYALMCLYDVSTRSIFGGYFGQHYIDQLDGDDEVVKNVTDCIAFHKKLNGKLPNLAVVPKARGRSDGRSTDLAGRTFTASKHKATSSSVLEFRAQDIINKNKLYRLPINVYQVAQDLGVSVVFESFPNALYMKLKGFCYKEFDFSMIGINKKHKTQLQRYSMAHELHHLLYDFKDASFACGPANQGEAIEIDAERFAAELLMPRPMVERLISNPLNISYLTVNLVAQHFGVSYEAAAIRLARFGLVNNSKEVCTSSYKKKDRLKTDFLLKNKSKYLQAVFGLETGIIMLQGYSEIVESHSLCGAPITDRAHTVCWHCGLEIHPPSPKEFCLKNPYRQKPSNLKPEKIISLNQVNESASDQLSLNLNVH